MVFKLLKKDFRFLVCRKLNFIFIPVALLLFLFEWNGFGFVFALILSMLFFELDFNVSFFSVLPVTKRQILLSKLLLIVIIQLTVMTLTGLGAFFSNFIPNVPNAGFTEVFLHIRFLVMIFSFINIVSCFAIARGEKISSAMGWALFAMLTVILALVGVQFLLENIGVMSEGAFQSDLVNNIFSCAIAVAYPLLTVLGYSLAVKAYSESDLFEKFREPTA